MIWIGGFFLSKYGDLYCVKLEIYCVLIMILIVETNLTPLKTPRITNILKLDTDNLDFEKFRPKFFKIMLKKICIF